MIRLGLLSLVFILFTAQCNSTNENSNEIHKDVTGVLKWGFSPASDGTGMTFITDGTTYGVPGIYEDYDEHFEENQFQVDVIVDYQLTGDQTSRGWGIIYVEIDLLSITIIE